MRIFPFQATVPVLDFVNSTTDFFASVKDRFTDYRESGCFTQRPKPGFYVHTIQSAQRTFTGIVANVHIHEYLSGTIRKHEETLPTSEKGQAKLLVQHAAQVKPVLLTYKPVPQISSSFTSLTEAKPLLEIHFTEDGQFHRIWEISDTERITLIQSLFNNHLESAYIADGHHRCSATALLYRQNGIPETVNPYTYITCAFYSFEDIEIHNFNRIIKKLPGFTFDHFLNSLSEFCHIQTSTELLIPSKKHELLLCYRNKMYRIFWKEQVVKEFQNQDPALDVGILNEKVFRQILGFKDISSNGKLRYEGGPEANLDFLKSGEKNDESITFMLYPVSLEDFLAISSNGSVMPPKSTWFEPRMHSGVIVREFN